MRERGEEDRSHPHLASFVGQGILRMMPDQNEKHTDPWAVQGLLSWTLFLGLFRTSMGLEERVSIRFSSHSLMSQGLRYQSSDQRSTR